MGAYVPSTFTKSNQMDSVFESPTPRTVIIIHLSILQLGLYKSSTRIPVTFQADRAVAHRRRSKCRGLPSNQFSNKR
jgi:hypothetical protein